MTVIDEIRARLSKYPNARYESNDSSITVLPLSNDGFSVALTVNPDGYTVSFNGWHEDFRSQEEPLNCFAFGLSDECRLKECRRGSFAHKWTLESKEGGRWVEDSTTGLFLFPFWRKPAVRYLQNNLLMGEQSEPAA
ncbi:MAG: hypothetical protein ACREA9_04010 [Pyrinomonadaceae bacterium]